MKALSIRQPWAWAILHAGKRVENRQWQRNTPRMMIGRIFLLHASAGCTREEYENAALSMQLHSGIEAPPLKSLPRGAVVGRVRLSHVDRIPERDPDPWAVPGALGLFLADVQVLETPIPFKGALGFFDVPDELLKGATWRAAT